MSKQKDIFISYAREAADWAAWIASALEAARFSVVYQAADMLPGQLVGQSIDNAIEHTTRTLALLSPAYFESKFCVDECKAAWHLDKLVPLLLTDCQLPPTINARQYIDLRGKSEEAARRTLLASISSILPARAQTIATGPSRSAPSFPDALRSTLPRADARLNLDLMLQIYGRPLTEWQADLFSGEPSTVRQALAVIEELGPVARGVVPALLRMLRDPSQVAAVTKVLVDVATNDERIIPAMVDLLGVEDPEVARNASRLLSSPRALPALSLALARSELYLGALATLVEIGPEALMLLVQTMAAEQNVQLRNAIWRKMKQSSDAELELVRIAQHKPELTYLVLELFKWWKSSDLIRDFALTALTHARGQQRNLAAELALRNQTQPLRLYDLARDQLESDSSALAEASIRVLSGCGAQGAAVLMSWLHKLSGEHESRARFRPLVVAALENHFPQVFSFEGAKLALSNADTRVLATHVLLDSEAAGLAHLISHRAELNDALREMLEKRVAAHKPRELIPSIHDLCALEYCSTRVSFARAIIPDILQWVGRPASQSERAEDPLDPSEWPVCQILRLGIDEVHVVYRETLQKLAGMATPSISALPRALAETANSLSELRRSTVFPRIIDRLTKALEVDATREAASVLLSDAGVDAEAILAKAAADAEQRGRERAARQEVERVNRRQAARKAAWTGAVRRWHASFDLAVLLAVVLTPFGLLKLPGSVWASLPVLWLCGCIFGRVFRAEALTTANTLVLLVLCAGGAGLMRTELGPDTDGTKSMVAGSLAAALLLLYRAYC